MGRWVFFLPVLGAGFLVKCVGDTTVVLDGGQDVTVSDGPNGKDVNSTTDTGVGDAASGDGTDGDGAIAPLPITPTVAIGYGFSCALRSSGRIYCWGQNASGQLGNQLTSNTPTPTPGQVAQITTAAQMGAGNDFACAVLTDHTVWCWGGNALGQLGQTPSSNNPTPTAVPGLTNVMEIAVGGSHVCARESDGSVWCWGGNSSDALGYDNASDTACVSSIPCNKTPTKVANLTADQLAAGIQHSCALVGTSAMCWGANDNGQLGHVPGTNGDLHPSSYYYNPTPKAASATGVAAVFAGGNVTCMLDGSQKVSCWGWDSAGQLGDKGTTQSAVPVLGTPVVSPGTQVAPGWLSTCAIANSSVYCWGDNTGGEEGTGADGGSSLAPTYVTGLTFMSTVASNHPGAHHCALATSGTVSCWGSNGYDELGHSNTSDGTCSGTKCSRTPTTVSGLP